MNNSLMIIYEKYWWKYQNPYLFFKKKKNDMAVFVSRSMKVDQLESNVI